MAKANVPDTISGDFFVLSYSRENETFAIALDDENQSSYKLGTDIQKVMMQFRIWGHSEIGNRAIDIAKEFGMAQAIFKDGRIIPLYEKPKPPALKFGDEEDKGYVAIPPLRSAR